MATMVEQEARTERAHFMCPGMHFGILARLQQPLDAQRLRQSVAALQGAHPFLQCLMEEEAETGRLCYRRQERLEIPVYLREKGDSWQQDDDALTGRGWNVMQESMLKLAAYPAEDGCQVLFIAHHLLCDGRGLLQLAEEFAQHYARGVEPRPCEERLIASLADLPPGSALPFVSRMIVDDANRRWRKEGRRVSYGEYLDFERQYLRDNPVRREVHSVDGPELESLLTLCRQQGVSVNDFLVAAMMQRAQTDRVIMAADIRRQLGCYQPGAMGNYATAFSVRVQRGARDLPALAGQVAAAVAAVRARPRRAMLILACYLRMEPGLLDAAAISSLGGFGSRAGALVGKGMFGYGRRDGHCVTNLGRLQSDVLTEAVFIPPASPANALTWGVLTVNGHMRVCAVTAEGGEQRRALAE